MIHNQLPATTMVGAPPGQKDPSHTLAALLTHGLQVDVDKVEAIVLQGVMRLGRDVQVAVALLVAQVHLDP